MTNVRHLRRVSPPLAAYHRVGHRDAALVARLLDLGLPVGAGVIVDPAARQRTDQLRTSALENGVEIILDPKSVELSTIGGRGSSSVARLEWAGTQPHTPDGLTGATGTVVAEQIAESVCDQGATAVLAPTHFLDLNRRWIDVDAALTRALRASLNNADAGTKVIYYPLVASLRLLRDHATMTAVVTSLRQLVLDRAIDGVFLRIQGFGTTKAGSQNLRNYIRVARRLHDLGVPIVGERTGTVGVALATTGAIGGVESSITFGDNYDARRLLKPPSGKGFLPPPRVYLNDAMMLVSKADADTTLSKRGLARMRCQRVCCQRGRDSMLEDPRRHFVVSRVGELERLSTVPETARAEDYLTTVLTPASRAAAQLAQVVPTLRADAHRNRLDSWYEAIVRTVEQDAAASTPVSTSSVPTGARLRRGA